MSDTTGVENTQGRVQRTPPSFNFTQQRKILHEKFMEDLKKKEAAGVANGCADDKTISDSFDRFFREMRKKQENRKKNGMGIPGSFKYHPYNPPKMTRQESQPSALKMCKEYKPSVLEMCKEYAQVQHIRKHTSQ